MNLKSINTILKNYYKNKKNKIYIDKLEKMYSNFNLYSSIDKKITKLYCLPNIKKILESNSTYNIEKSKALIYDYVTTILFNYYSNKEIKFNKQTLIFVLNNNIDKILFENITIFNEEILFINKFNKCSSKKVF